MNCFLINYFLGITYVTVTKYFVVGNSNKQQDTFKSNYITSASGVVGEYIDRYFMSMAMLTFLCVNF